MGVCMPSTSESSSNVVILHGNDEFQVDQAARKLLAARCPQAEGEGGLTTLRGDVDTVDQARETVKSAISASQSMSMFSPVNATWLREVSFLSGTLFKSEEVKRAVEHLQTALAKGLGPEQFFLMTVSGKLAKNSRFYKAGGENGGGAGVLEDGETVGIGAGGGGYGEGRAGGAGNPRPGPGVRGHGRSGGNGCAASCAGGGKAGSVSWATGGSCRWRMWS